jgi:hypothetical protein
MAEGDYVEPLTGTEIRNDLLFHIDEKLARDCNLRETDSYAGGYHAKVSIELEAYGMDTALVTRTVEVGTARPDPDERVETTLEVPVEPALNAVRERSDQPVPTLTTVGGEPEVRQRRYVKRGGGGATGERV